MRHTPTVSMDTLVSDMSYLVILDKALQRITVVREARTLMVVWYGLTPLAILES